MELDFLTFDYQSQDSTISHSDSNIFRILVLNQATRKLNVKVFLTSIHIYAKYIYEFERGVLNQATRKLNVKVFFTLIHIYAKCIYEFERLQL